MKFWDRLKTPPHRRLARRIIETFLEMHVSHGTALHCTVKPRRQSDRETIFSQEPSNPLASTASVFMTSKHHRGNTVPAIDSCL